MSGAGPTASVPFDSRPLTEPVDHGAVRAFTQRLRQSGASGAIFSAGTAGAAVAVVVAVIVGFVFVFVAFTVITTFVASGSGAPGPLALGAVVMIVLIGGALTLIVFAAVRGWRGAGERRYRLDRFATANGMSYVPTLAAPSLPGMIFDVGGSRASSDLLRGEQPRFVEFANYRYTTGSGKNRTTHEWGYVAIKLDVPLPNIVLDATSNNGLFRSSNLPASFDKDQKLSLEGDFDQYFSLYCPQGYEADALYLFTPDIMARFIDSAAAVDVEIVDDWLFLYGKRDFSTLDPATWAWLFGTVAALLDKLAQWARWRDDRLAGAPEHEVVLARGPAEDGAPAATAQPAASVLPFGAPPGLLTPPPGVAAPGRRLSRKVPWITFVAAGIFVVLWLIGQFDFFSGFFGR